MPSTNANAALAASVNLASVVRPVAEDSSGATPPENSEVRKIAEDVLGALKYSFASVAANPATPVRPGSVEALFKEALQKTPAAQRSRYQQTAAPLVNAPVPIRTVMFGRAGERGPDDHLGAVGGFERYREGLAPLAIDRKLLGVRTPTISAPLSTLRSTPEGLLIPAAALPPDFEGFQHDFESAEEKAVESGVLADDRLADIWGPAYVGDPFADQAPDSDFEEMQTTDKLGLWLTKVKCIDETNPEWWGSDEIALAGVTVDEDGDTKKVGEKYIGGGFDDGDEKNYPNWRYTHFGLREGQYWPKTYSVTLLLAEKDHGGLSNALNSVWEKVGEHVKKAIAEAVGGVLTPYLGAVIAKAIGQAVAWIVNALVLWIIDAFKDDIFPPFTATVTTPSLSARWHHPNGTWGNPSSGIRTARFSGHGGSYQVLYYWKFFA